MEKASFTPSTSHQYQYQTTLEKATTYAKQAATEVLKARTFSQVASSVAKLFAIALTPIAQPVLTLATLIAHPIEKFINQRAKKAAEETNDLCIWTFNLGTGKGDHAELYPYEKSLLHLNYQAAEIREKLHNLHLENKEEVSDCITAYRNFETADPNKGEMVIEEYFKKFLEEGKKSALKLETNNKPDAAQALRKIMDDLSQIAQKEQQFNAQNIQDYQEAVEYVSRELSAASPDVLCLQEVNDFERPEMQALREKYTIVSCKKEDAKGGVNDSAIALDKNKFKNVEDCSFAGDFLVEKRNVTVEGVSVAVATDVRDGKRYAFVSCKMPGVNIPRFEDSTDLDSLNVHLDGARKVMQAVLNEMERICQEQGVDVVIIGADMNLSAEQVISKARDHGLSDSLYHVANNMGYGINGVLKDTAVNLEDKHRKAENKSVNYSRNIDKFLVKSIKAKNTFEVEGSLPATWDTADPKTHTSDHVPVQIRLKATKPKRWFSKLNTL